jgi:hypothetical protein
MTSIYVFVFGKYQEKKDFENDFKDKNMSLNKVFKILIRKFYQFKLLVIFII